MIEDALVSKNFKLNPSNLTMLLWASTVLTFLKSSNTVFNINRYRIDLFPDKMQDNDNYIHYCCCYHIVVYNFAKSIVDTMLSIVSAKLYRIFDLRTTYNYCECDNGCIIDYLFVRIWIAATRKINRLLKKWLNKPGKRRATHSSYLRKLIWTWATSYRKV